MGDNIYKYGGIPPKKRPLFPSMRPEQMIVKYGGIPPKPAPPPGYSIPENEGEIGNPFEKFSYYQIIIVLIKEFIKLNKRIKILEKNQPSIFPIMDGPENSAEEGPPLKTTADVLREIRSLRNDVNGLQEEKRKEKRRMTKAARMMGVPPT